MTMPVYTRETLAIEAEPWIAITDFEFIRLDRTRTPAAHETDDDDAYWGTISDTPAARSVRIIPQHPRERLVVISGEVMVESELGRFTLQRRDWVDVPATGMTITNRGYSWTEIARIAGNWEETARTEICAFSPEFPCELHYHDGDEYWFVYRGHFTLEYDDGAEVMAHPGMMLAASAGTEHGATAPEEYFEAIVLATGLIGTKRDGHLTRKLHGVPAALRTRSKKIVAE
jgi:quercetin dioxygenase-like cupin family protein